MRATETESELVQAAERSGCTVVRATYGQACGPGDALRVWEAFKELAVRDARDPIAGDDGERLVGPDPDCDLLLFETTTMEAMHERGYRLGGDPPQPQVLLIGLTRQFSLVQDGEYAGMSGLHVSVEHLLTPELEAVSGAQLWGHAGPPGDGVGGDNPEFGAAWTGDVHAWIAALERHPAFGVVRSGRDAYRVGFLYTDI